MTKDNEIPGLENARGWYASIVEMVEALENPDKNNPKLDADYEAQDEARERIHESVLSVEVRSDWYGALSYTPDYVQKAAEYRILLTTGGPALQLVGTLSEHGEPETAELQSQDWFEPLTPGHPNALIDLSKGSVPLDDAIAFGDKVRETLLTFARCFYFGE